MAATTGERERRPLGVILIIELWGRLQGPAARNKRPWAAQLREAVGYFNALLSRSHLPEHPEAVIMDSSEENGAVVDDVPFNILRVLTDPFPGRVEMQSIPIHAVGSGLLQDDENGPGEYTILIEDAAFNGDGDPPLDEAHVRGLDLEVQELVRAKKVRRIRAYRVLETVPGSARG